MGFDAWRPFLTSVLSACMCLIAAPALAQTADIAATLPEIEVRGAIYNVNTPTPTGWRPDEREQSVPLDLFARYRALLATGAYEQAYMMLSARQRAESSFAEWQSLFGIVCGYEALSANGQVGHLAQLYGLYQKLKSRMPPSAAK